MVTYIFFRAIFSLSIIHDDQSLSANQPPRMVRLFAGCQLPQAIYPDVSLLFQLEQLGSPQILYNITIRREVTAIEGRPHLARIIPPSPSHECGRVPWSCVNLSIRLPLSLSQSSRSLRLLSDTDLFPFMFTISSKGSYAILHLLKIVCTFLSSLILTCIIPHFS